MNDRQQLVLLVGMGVFLGMLVCCPWTEETYREEIVVRGGYRCGGLVCHHLESRKLVYN
jgi:hypothetical protein